MSMLKIGDVTVTKVVELDRSSFAIGSMLPDSTPERIEAQRDWLGPELLDAATGVHKASIQSYVVRTPQHTVVIDGRVVVDAYRQTFADEPRLFAKVQEIGERLQARTGISFPRSKWPMS